MANKSPPEMLWQSFQRLSRKEKDAFLLMLVEDDKTCEDILDLAIAESRSKDKSRPFDEFVRDHS